MKKGFGKPNRLLLVVGLLLGSVFLCSILVSSPVAASVANNQTINFQGRLLNAQGATVPDGYYNLEFKIYKNGDGQSVGDTTGSPAGTLLWTEDWLNSGGHGVKVQNGYLSVNLGAVNPFGSSVDWTQGNLWLSMQVGNTSSCTISTNFQTDCGGDGEMTPMQPLTASPYALNAGLLDGVSSAGFVQLAQGLQTDASNNTSIYINKTGTGNILDLQSAGADAFTVTNSGDLTFGANTNHTLSVATAGSGNAGNSLTIASGAAGSGGSALAGGNLVLEGGAGGGTNGNGGNVNIDAGAKNGSGNDGNINIGTNHAAAITIGNTNGASATNIQAGTGGIALSTGAGSGTTGSISITTGNSSGGASGNITIDAGSNVPSGTLIADKTFEGSLDNMVDGFGYTDTLTDSSAQHHNGSQSLEITAGGTPNWIIADDSPYPISITAGHTYLFSAWIRANSTSGTDTFSADFSSNGYGGGGSVGTYEWGSGTDNPSGWTQVTGTLVAPNGANYVGIVVEGTDSATGEIHYLDDISLTDISTTNSPAIDIGTTNAQAVNIGNSNQSAATNINGGGGGVNINAGPGADLNVGTSAVNAVLIGSAGGDGTVTEQSAGITQTLTNSGSEIVETQTNTSTALQVQNANGYGVFTVDTSSNSGEGQVVLGQAGQNNGTLEFESSASSGGAVTLEAPSITSSNSYSLILPNAAPSGSGQCLQTSSTTQLSFGTCGATGSFIFNQSTQQTSANFNISGEGQLGTLDATGSGSANTLAIGAGATYTGAINIDTSSSVTTGTVTIGGTAQTGNITVGQYTGSGTSNVYVADGATTGTQNVYIGNGATGAGIDNVTVGANTNTANTTTIEGGNGSGAIALTPQTTGVITIGASAGTGNIVLGSSSGAQTVQIANGAGAGVVQIANVQTAGSVAVGAAMTTGTITVGGTAQTGNLTVGSSSGAQSVLIANGSGASTVSIANVQTAGSVSVGSGMTTGTITLGGTAQTGNITVGQATTSTQTTNIENANATAGTQTVNIDSGNGTASTQTVNIAGGSSTTSGGKTVNIANGTPGTGTTNSVFIGNGGTTTGTVAVTIGSNGNAAHTTTIEGGNGSGAIALTPQTTGVITIGASAGTGNIVLGSSSGAQTVQIANGAGAGVVQIANVQTAGSVAVGAAMTTGTITVGGTAQTGNIVLGQYNGSSSSTINIGDNAGSSSTQNVNIGASGSGNNNVTVGSNSGTGAVNINSGSGNVNINNNDGNVTNINTGTSSGAVNIGNGSAGNIGITSSSSNSITSTAGATSETIANTGDTIKTSTNSSTAFQVQNASAEPIFQVSTTTNNLVSNPGFEVNTTGWAASGSGASITRNTTVADTYDSQDSLAVTLGSGAGTGASTNTFTSSPAAGNYTFSFFAMGSASLTGLAVAVAGGSAPTCTLNTTTVSSSGFQEYYCSFTTSGSAITSLTITVTTASQTLYIDAVQLTNTTTLNPYQIGSIQLRGVITNPQVFEASSNSTTAFQVQNSSGNDVLAIDTQTGTGQVVLGQAGQNNGTLEFESSASSGGAVTLEAPSITSSNSYSLILPNAAPSGSGQCLQTSSTTQLSFGTCGATGSFIFNQSTQQTSANFNISGEGQLGTLDATGSGSANTLAIGAGATYTGAINIDTSSSVTTGTVTIGGTAQTGNITVGQYTGSGTSNVYVADGATTGTQNVYIGNGATGAGIDNVTVGANTNTANTTTIEGGNGSGAIALTPQTTGVITIGASAGTGNIVLGSSSGAQTVQIANGAGAGVVQIANVQTAGSVAVGAAMTTGTITVGGTAQTGNLTVGSSSGAQSVLIANGSGASTVSIANVQTAGSVSVGSGMTTGTITLGGTAQTGNITVGQATTSTQTTNIENANATAGTQTVNIDSGNGTASTQTVNIAGGSSTTSGGKTVNIANGTPGTGTTNSVFIGNGGTTTGTVAVTIGSNGNAAHTTTIEGGNGSGAIALTPQTTGVITIGASAGTGNIVLGSSSGAQTVQIANGAGAGVVQIANVQTAGSVAVGAAMTTGTITVGGTAQTGNIVLGQYNGSSSSTINIGDNAGSSSTQNVNIGASGSGNNNVTVGSNSGTGAVNINSGSGNVNINNNDGNVTNINTGTSSGAVNIGNGSAGNIGITSSSSNSITSTAGATSETIANTGDTIKTSTNSSTAFQVQNASAEPIFQVSTTTNNLVSNPGFEVNTTGWAASGSGASITRNTTVADTYDSQDSLAVTLGSGSGTGASVSSFTSSPAAGHYTFSFFAMGSASLTGLAVAVAGGSAPTCTLNTTTVSSSGFQEYYCSFTTSGSAITSLTITVTTASQTLYIDAVQLTNTTTLNPYQIGSIQLRGVITNPQVFEASSNSTTAFQVQNATGSDTLDIDTLDGYVGIGKSNPAYPLDVNGVVNVSTGSTYDINGVAICASTGCTASATSAILNQSTQQTSANFNISGEGQLGTLDATGSGSANTLAIGAGATYTGAINIDTSSSVTTGTVTIGGTAQTGNITVGQYTGSGTSNVYVADGATTGTQNVYIGNGATGAGIDNVTVGANTNTANTTTIEGGNGSGAIALTPQTTGVITIGASAGTGNIVLGSSSGAQTVQIANGAGAGVVQIANVQTAGSVAVGAAMTTGTITVGGTAQTGNLTVGSSSGAQSVLIANGSGASTVSIANVQTAGSVSVGSGMTTGTITLGGTAQTGNITVGQATTSTQTTNIENANATAGTQTVNIDSGNGTASTQTVNIAGGSSTTSGGKTVNIANGTPGTGTTNSVFIGNGGTTTGTVAVTIGSNGNAAHTTTIEGGNGSGAIALTPQTTGVITIGASAGTGNIVLGSSSGAQTVQIANGAGAGVVQIANVQTAGSVAVGAAMTTGTITVGGTAQTGNLTVGSSSGAQSVLIANGSGASTVSIANVQTAGSVSVGSGMTTGTITLGGTAQTGTITIGQFNSASGSSTVNIGNNTATGGTQNVNIATSSNGTNNVTVGSTNSAGQTKLQAGATSETISNTGDTIQTSTNSSTAFQIQNSSAEPIFTVNTTTTNLISNPGFEVNTTGWAASGSGASIARYTTSGSHIYFGQASLAVTLGSGAGTGASTNTFTSSPGIGNYTFSFFANGSTALTGLAVAVTGGGAPTCTLNTTTVSSSGFQEYYCSFTTTGSAITAIAITVTTASQTLYLDSVQLTNTSSLNPYQIGSIQLRGVITNPQVFEASSNSTTAFQVQNATGSDTLDIDTLDGYVGIGKSNPAYPLDVNGVVNVSTGSTYDINGVAICASTGCTASATSAILNQSTQQTSANFNISGEGQLGTLDATGSGSANTLAIGAGATYTGAINIDTSSSVTTGTVTIGGTAQTGNITVGQSTGSNTIFIGNANTTAGNTQTIDIGAGTGVTSGKSVVTIGSSANASSLSLQSGTGDVQVATSGVVRTTFDTSNDLFYGNGITASSPNNFTLSGTGSSTTAVTGGTITLQGGNATVGNANGGNLTLTGGTGFGTGVNGIVVINTPTFATTSNDPNCYTGGTLVASSCTVAQATVNNTSAVIIGFSATGQTATLPSPSNTTAGKLMYVTAANGSSDFTLSVNGGGTGNTIAMRQNTTATMIWSGTEWTAAGASSSTTLQSAYNNTLQSAGGAELVVSDTSNTDGLNIRDSSTNPVDGDVLTVQNTSAALLFSVNDNVTQYASDGGAETYGGTTSTFPSSTWSAFGTGPTVSRYTTVGNDIATGQGSVSTITTAAANIGVANELTTSLTANLDYNVSFAARLASGSATFSTMNVYYSVNGTTQSVACVTGQDVDTSVWTKVNCTFQAPSSGITSTNSILIFQTDATARTFYVDNLSVTINASQSYATDGGVDNAGSFTTNWPQDNGSGGTDTVTRSTTVGQSNSDSAQVVTTAHTGQGVANLLSINPLANTLYQITVYAASTSTFNTFNVSYSPNNGSHVIQCADYNTQSISTSVTSFTQVTCYIQTDSTAVTTPYLYFTQTDATARTFYVDTLSMTLASNTTQDVQIGGGVDGGAVTLLTLDSAAGPPIASNNATLLGSMYYNTTLGELQCYESTGWGPCGAAADTIVTLSPEYTNAVLHGPSGGTTGVGTMTSDFCSSTLNINNGTSGQPTICGSNETFNFYHWTSPQATAQTYAIYVTYQLPQTFSSFASGQTSLMGFTDSSNSSVAYKIYNDSSGGLTECGTSVSVSSGVQTTWQTATATGSADPSTCSFVAGDSILFEIDMTASSNANAYVGNLNFTFANNN